MPDTYQQQSDADRARQAQWQEEDRSRQGVTPPEPVSFPWGMFCLAALFDAVGWIPILNLVTEPLAGLIFGWWQKGYAPKTDPILTFIIAKIIDAVSLGILPSNIGIVVYAYIEKKTAAKIAAAANTRLGSMALNKMLKNQQA